MELWHTSQYYRILLSFMSFNLITLLCIILIHRNWSQLIYIGNYTYVRTWPAHWFLWSIFSPHYGLDKTLQVPHIYYRCWRWSRNFEISYFSSKFTLKLLNWFNHQPHFLELWNVSIPSLIPTYKVWDSWLIPTFLSRNLEWSFCKIWTS